MTAQMAERLHYPLGGSRRSRRAACPTRTSSQAPPCSLRPRRLARLDRPLEATRAHLLAGQVLLGYDDARAGELLAAAAAERRLAWRTWRRRPDGGRDRRTTARRLPRPGSTRGNQGATNVLSLGRTTYCARSAPAITTTVASPASSWLARSIGSRWPIPRRLFTARASRWWPCE